MHFQFILNKDHSFRSLSLSLCLSLALSFNFLLPLCDIYTLSPFSTPLVCHTHSHCLSLSLSLSLSISFSCSIIHTHTLSLFSSPSLSLPLSLSVTYTHNLSIYQSLSHIHTHTLSLSLSFHLLSLSLSLSLCLSHTQTHSVSLHLSVSICLSLCVCVCVCLPLSLSLSLSLSLFQSPSHSLSHTHSISLSLTFSCLSLSLSLILILSEIDVCVSFLLIYILFALFMFHFLDKIQKLKKALEYVNRLNATNCENGTAETLALRLDRTIWDTYANVAVKTANLLSKYLQINTANGSFHANWTKSFQQTMLERASSCTNFTWCQLRQFTLQEQQYTNPADATANISRPDLFSVVNIHMLLYLLVQNNVDTDSPVIFGSAVAFEPYVVPCLEKYSPYAHKVGRNSIYVEDLSSKYNYLDSTIQWYSPVKSKVRERNIKTTRAKYG